MLSDDWKSINTIVQWISPQGSCLIAALAFNRRSTYLRPQKAIVTGDSMARPSCYASSERAFIVEPVAKVGVHIRAARLMAHALVGSGFYASHGFTALFGS
jgi:hypothetical protein